MIPQQNTEGNTCIDMTHRQEGLGRQGYREIILLKQFSPPRLLKVQTLNHLD